MKKLLKKLGYGYSIHYNEYRKKFETYQTGIWSPGMELTKDSRVSSHKNPKKSIKNFLKKYKV